MIWHTSYIPVAKMLKYSTVSARIYSAKDITIYPETSVSVPPRLDASGISNTCTVVYTVYSLYLYSQKCEQLLRFFFFLCIAFCFVFQSEILHAKQNCMYSSMLNTPAYKKDKMLSTLVLAAT